MATKSYSESVPVTLLVWGDDATHGRFASLLDEIRRGEREGSVEEHTDDAVEFAIGAGAPDEWTTEWAVAIESDEQTIEDVEAAADQEPGVCSYKRRE